MWKSRIFPRGGGGKQNKASFGGYGYSDSGSAIPWPKELPAPDNQFQSYRDQVIDKGLKQAYQPWTAQEEEELRRRYLEQVPVPALAELHQRTKGAILSRLKKLGLVEETDFPTREKKSRTEYQPAATGPLNPEAPGKSRCETHPKNKRVEVFSKVSYINTQTNRTETFRIVPSYAKYEHRRMGGAYYGNIVSVSYLSDSDPDKGTIGAESPLAKALLGHYVGDEVKFKTPGGEVMNLKILSVQHQKSK